MQTHSTDLYLRPENLYALSSASISLSSLLCIDQVPGEILQRAPSDGGPSYALVDHNVLLPSLRASNSTEDQVVAILDHHVDESSHLSASPRTIQPVGSCVSLIAQHFLVDLDPSSTDVPSGLADLILSSILIDTGLKPTTSGGKATQVDLTAVQILLPFASPLFSSTPSPSSSSISTQTTEPFAGLMAVNKILGEKKFSVDHLGGRDLLRRDYKEYQLDDDDQTIRYGLSTIPLPLSNWLTKEVEGKSGWDLVLQEVEDWKKERGLDMAAILTSFDLSPDHPLRVGGKKLGGMGKHARELLVHVGGDSNSGHGKKGKMQGLFQGLEEEGSLQLGEWKGAIALGEEGFKGGQGWRVWQQGPCICFFVRGITR